MEDYLKMQQRSGPPPGWEPKGEVKVIPNMIPYDPKNYESKVTIKVIETKEVEMTDEIVKELIND